jgi:hypothetical protein
MTRDLRYKQHSEQVAAWIDWSTSGLKKQHLAEHFEKTILALLNRAQPSVSDLTLAAILERVLYNSTEQFPLLQFIQIINGRWTLDPIQKKLENFDEIEIKKAFHYLITEFLFIIGNLTGEQLTPILHKELQKDKA